LCGRGAFGLTGSTSNTTTFEWKKPGAMPQSCTTSVTFGAWPARGAQRRLGETGAEKHRMGRVTWSGDPDRPRVGQIEQVVLHKPPRHAVGGRGVVGRASLAKNTTVFFYAVRLLLSSPLHAFDSFSAPVPCRRKERKKRTQGRDGPQGRRNVFVISIDCKFFPGSRDTAY